MSDAKAHFEGQAPDFEWSADRRGSVLTVSLKGELDLAAADAANDLKQALESDERLVVVDLASLAFIDSTGLRMLIKVKQQTEAKGGRLLLGRLSQPARRLLEVAGLTQWFEYLEGAIPRRTYCPICEGELTPELDRCPHCGSVF
jgi:anti-anti-sigma factor